MVLASSPGILDGGTGTLDRHGGSAGAFVGRQDELAQLRVKLDEVRAGDPRVVLVEGAPGFGKTALLQRFLSEAGDARVLRANGEQEEHLLPYGVAEQLAGSVRVPLNDQLARLGARADRSPEPFAVGAGFVELLSALQEEGPVAVVIDDAQWADRPSLLALLFALRRLQADRVLALIAARSEDTGRLPEGLLKLLGGERGATLRLGGLSATELQELASAISAEPLSPALAEQLRDHTDGSPLHLRALLEELPLEKLGRTTDAPLPCPRTFGMQVLSRLGDCPPEAERLVVAASVLGPQCRLVLAQRLADVSDPLGALEGAMSASLLEARDVDGEQGLAFPHALIRGAIYHDIGPARRAALHLRAAELVGDETASLRHRSAAALGEDEPLAADLADHAHRLAARGAWAQAAAALLRSARLSPAREDREQRLLDAVDCLLEGGDVTRATALTDAVHDCADGPFRTFVLGRLAYHAGRRIDGEGLLLRAWDACEPTQDRQLASRIAEEVATVLVRRSRGAELVTWARRAIAAADGPALGRRGWTPLAYGLAYAGHAAQGLAELAFLPEAPRDLRSEHVDALYARGALRFFSDDLVGARADLSLVEPAAARWGPFRYRWAALSLLSGVEYRLGDWDGAVAHGELGASIAEAADQTWILSLMHAAATAPLAGRGDWEAARAHAQGAAECARLVNDENSVADAGIAQAQIASARGDHRGVVAALTLIVEMPGREGIDEPGARWPWQELQADALVSLGRLDEAEAILAPFEELAAARGRRSSMANAARVRGNLEAARRSIDAAEDAFRRAFGHSDDVSIPFDRARLDAAYGRFLRRIGRRPGAVTHLKAARERFAQLGARPYVEACDQVLAASGVAPSPREGQRATLTPQEVVVARQVSQGLSNREVAAKLVMSVNTVEFHLKNIYSKLGVFSRRQLADQLARA